MNKKNYSIWQLKQIPEGHERLYVVYDKIKNKLNPELYEKVWEDTIEYDDDFIKAVVSKLNADLPIGFYGHMINISDIIKDEDENKAWYVDNIGYKELNNDITSKLV